MISTISETNSFHSIVPFIEVLDAFENRPGRQHTSCQGACLGCGRPFAASRAARGVGVFFCLWYYYTLLASNTNGHAFFIHIINVIFVNVIFLLLLEKQVEPSDKCTTVLCYNTVHTSWRGDH